MIPNEKWEFIIARIKNGSRENPIIGFCANYMNCAGGYTVLMLGMDYQYLNSHKIYKQLLYQIIIRAKSAGANKVFLGFSANTEKKKLGARYSKSCFCTI